MAKTGSRGLSPLLDLTLETQRDALWRRIAGSLRAGIETGRIAPGTRLASTRTLARDWGVSRNTVAQVFATLTDEGFLTARVGDGTYVARPSAPSPTAQPTSSLPAYPFRHLSHRGRDLIGRPALSHGGLPRALMPNVPDLKEFPLRSWLRLMNEVSGRLTGNALAGVSPAGYGPLRQSIAHHVSVTRGLTCRADQVIVTTGSQQGLDLALRLLADRGDPVWLENPNYPGLAAALSANGANLQPVPVDAEGMDVAAGRETRLAPRVICVSSARHYPTGAILSPARRRALLDHAHRSGAWVVEDDFCADFHYETAAPPLLAAEDSCEAARGRVVTLGTFSMTLVPSLRLGYLIAPPDLAPAFMAARSVSQGHAPLLEQMVLAEMMNRGFYAAHIRRMRRLYHARQKILRSAIDANLGHRFPEAEAKSGLHLVLPLASGREDVRIARTLSAAGAICEPLSPCHLQHDADGGLLLGFAAYTDQQITAAVEVLARTLSKYAQTMPTSRPCPGLIART